MTRSVSLSLALSASSIYFRLMRRDVLEYSIKSGSLHERANGGRGCRRLHHSVVAPSTYAFITQCFMVPDESEYNLSCKW